MTQPIPMYTPDKSRNFGHAIVGYYKDNHKWLPVNVNQDGYLLFKQDPDTAAAISAFAASIEALIAYVHDSMGEMQTAQQNFITQANTDFQNNFDSMKTEVLAIENTFKTNLENLFQQEINAIDSTFNTSIGNLNTAVANASSVLNQFQSTVNTFDNKVALFNNTVDEFDSAVDRLNETLDDFISMSEEEISTVVDTAFSPLSDSEINEIVQEGWGNQL